MSSIHYVGLDVHKKTISYCVKTATGRIRDAGRIPATRAALTQWAAGRDRPWVGAMEATLFTGWVYDHLRPYARALKVAHPVMVRAIGASKKKSDRVDASKIADLLRCNLLPECYMAPPEIRELRRILRFRNLIVRQASRMKNKVASLLMEVGAPYNKQKLHGKRYFAKLLDTLEDVPDSVIDMLRMSRGSMEFFQAMQQRLTDGLRQHPTLEQRVGRLMTIPGVGEVMALTWALEVGDPHRFGALREAISYCGLCSAQHSSAGRERRGPISKQRNKHLQSMLIEAAKLAPRFNSALAETHQRQLQRGHRNRATLAVARKLVAYLLAVDKRPTDFQPATAVAAAT